ncbi:Shedu immune nuclease family protein [Nocardia sp. N2S4-5]|uniref:Shedu immune nuclease family protein n=1 Tax=Nocardia sp. N2S4-5 TaxID=3351565 RepID=UPI0037D3B0CC
MARIIKVLPNEQNIRAHDLANGVECEYQVIQDATGERLLHLSTFGSQQRMSTRKSSQSLQVDRKTARDLIGVFDRTFGFETIDMEKSELADAYRSNPELFRQLIASDITAEDVIALTHRRAQVDRFRRLLRDVDYFSAEVERVGGGSEEKVWQRFFEENPWIFGVSLAGQFLTSWDADKLETIVSGASVTSVGKRADALLATSGLIKSIVFAEIKTHKTPILGTEYRSGCWSPSAELSGGVAQVQGTVHIAAAEFDDRLQAKAPDGSDIPAEYAYVFRPRSFLIIGNLGMLRGLAGGENQAKVRSFELYRRNLMEPEVLTFDEVLARAEWAADMPSSV